ncbi:MAG TPA: hypothetical protein VIF60_20335 [Burkholderiaceae bacterium]|jgi:hypothetical protein
MIFIALHSTALSNAINSEVNQTTASDYMPRIFDGPLQVHYGQAYVLPSNSYGLDLNDSFRGQTNGLCGAATPGALFLITGQHTGQVGFTLDVLETAPTIDEKWE